MSAPAPINEFPLPPTNPGPPPPSKDSRRPRIIQILLIAVISVTAIAAVALIATGVLQIGGSDTDQTAEEPVAVGSQPQDAAPSAVPDEPTAPVAPIPEPEGDWASAVGVDSEGYPVFTWAFEEPDAADVYTGPYGSVGILDGALHVESSQADWYNGYVWFIDPVQAMRVEATIALPLPRGAWGDMWRGIEIGSPDGETSYLLETTDGVAVLSRWSKATDEWLELGNELSLPPGESVTLQLTVDSSSGDTTALTARVLGDSEQFTSASDVYVESFGQFGVGVNSLTVPGIIDVETLSVSPRVAGNGYDFGNTESAS